MNSHFSKAFAVALGGFLASCASTPQSASLSGRPQMAQTQQSASDAPLRVGLRRQAARRGQCALDFPKPNRTSVPCSTRLWSARVSSKRRSTPRVLFSPRQEQWCTWSPLRVLPKSGLDTWSSAIRRRSQWQATRLKLGSLVPLAEPDSSYAVSSTGDGFAVSIRSTHYDAAKRIIEASERLAPSNSPHHEALAVKP